MIAGCLDRVSIRGPNKKLVLIEKKRNTQRRILYTITQHESKKKKAERSQNQTRMS
jgi:hypothetical protein